MNEIPLKWQQYAVRAIFFFSGFGCATWAPLVPIVKQGLSVSDDIMGMLLLCIGIGSFLSMPLSGALARKYGCRKVITIASIIFIIILLAITQVNSVYQLVPLLLVFGSAMGLIDVVMNINAVFVEQASGRSIMSNFHAMWSIGCFVGAGIFGIWLSLGLSPLMATIIAVLIMLALLSLCYGKLLPYGAKEDEKESTLLAIPKGIIIFFSIIIGISFLAEGAVMDWSGIYITEVHGMDIALAGTGYSIYSVAMFLTRITGDYAVNRFGKKIMVAGGLLLSFIGFMLLVFASWEPLIFSAFFLMGIGLANVVPVIYSLAGNQTDMPSGQAVAAMGTFGYLGILCGPAAIGYISNATSLNWAFGVLAVLIIIEITLAIYIFSKNKL
ncbi:MAG: MFS transporter [Selenomonadaceae bacterium]|nr:MFS transporter [Selenomonadaceae bacterium]